MLNFNILLLFYLTEVWAEVYLPPHLKKEHITQYPLMVHTYGGPSTQKVSIHFYIAILSMKDLFQGDFDMHIFRDMKMVL